MSRAMPNTTSAIGAIRCAGLRRGRLAELMTPRWYPWRRAPMSGVRARAGQVPVDRVHRISALEALQAEVARLAELDVARAVDLLAQRGGHEHLAAARLRRDAGGHHHVAPEEVVALTDRLAGVKPHADPDLLAALVCAPRQRPLDAHRALHRRARVGEHDHEAVARRLHLEAAVQAHAVADDRVVLAQHLEPAPVAQALVDLRRALDVAE